MKIKKSENLAEVVLSYRAKVKSSDMPQITSSSDVYEILKRIYNPDTVQHHEEAIVLLLNTPNRVLGWVKISVGGITNAVIDVRIVFQYAINANATGLIISHNHPSGIAKPSEQDRLITKKLVEGGKLLDIRVMDHIIYTENGYYSFADEAEI